MLTVAYCRVSTEEQAAEGFSIAGQADKLRVYAELHDLGGVTVIADPGLSGKNLERPGLQQLLHMVDEGHVANVITWRLDRLSRNLGDLIMLADRFGQANVALHSFTEKIDLSSATGRMFYNILGSFAQFYREQLAENVRMGMQQAVRQGKWVNRPKTGYDLVDGELVPNEMAPVVRRIFTIRGEGASQGKIAEATGVKYSTVLSILGSRIYLGEVQMNGEWFAGHHEAIITPEPFAAAHRGRVKGRARGTDLLSGRVRCGLCERLMALDQNGQGASSIAATTGARAVGNPAARTSGSTVQPSWGCSSSATMSNCRPPSAGNSSWPERRPPRPAEAPDLALTSRGRGPGGPTSQAAAPLLRRQGRSRPVRRRGGSPVRGDPGGTARGRRMLGWRRRGTTMWHSTSMTSHNCSQRSTSTRHGVPPQTSSDEC